MENYIVINGKKTELTKEQLIALGIEIKIEKEDPFEPKKNVSNYFISSAGEVQENFYDKESAVVRVRYAAANYCTNKAFMEQRALHETLNRLLWRYSMQHDGDEIDWSDRWQDKYKICYDTIEDSYIIDESHFHKTEGSIYFISEEVAEDAIEEVVKPFIKQHPEFEW